MVCVFGISGILQDILMKFAHTFKAQLQDIVQSFVASCQQETYMSSFFSPKNHDTFCPLPCIIGMEIIIIIIILFQN